MPKIEVSHGPDGRFLKGKRYSRKTEFKKGQHWRPHKIFRERDYLVQEYGYKRRSAVDIALEHGVTENAILFWLRKHRIKTRTMSQIRKNRKWGSSGSMNPMYGRKGPLSPNWKGGSIPLRLAFYSSREWRISTRKIRWRDKRICRRCGVKCDKNNPVCYHHIISFLVEELRCELTNLATMCTKCHLWIHSRKNSNKEWIGENARNRFKAILANERQVNR